MEGRQSNMTHSVEDFERSQGSMFLYIRDGYISLEAGDIWLEVQDARVNRI